MSDSVRFDQNNVAVFQKKEKETGGIFLIFLSDRKTYFEFLLNNGDEMSITAKSTDLPTGLIFNGSPENERFVAYQKYLWDFGRGQQALQREISAAKTAADTAAVRKKAVAASKDLIDYRTNYAAKYPGTLLANLFNALWVPQVPEGKHYTADGQVDSTFPYVYYKSHFWDKFNFRDDRLVQTPIYEAKLEEYFNKLVPPLVDSVEKEADTILARTRGTQDLFKYNLWWLKNNAQQSKVMGMDEVFVYLVEKYYMKGDAPWMSAEDLQKNIDYAQKIAPNVIGNLAPEIIMQDIDGKKINLSSIKAKYTLLVFWAPGCGHCQQMIPKIDSAYRASLKAKGVRVYAVRTEDDPKQWQDFIKEHHLEEWTHVYDPEHHSDFRSKYNVYTTPVIYLLDEKKIIIGKRLDNTNIGQLIEIHERKGKSAAR
jgi:peroxiredoxin